MRETFQSQHLKKYELLGCEEKEKRKHSFHIKYAGIEEKLPPYTLI